MWWTQADAEGYRFWLRRAGFIVELEAVVPDGPSAHTLFRARKPFTSKGE
jgi:hypothetical protein